MLRIGTGLSQLVIIILLASCASLPPSTINGGNGGKGTKETAQKIIPAIIQDSNSSWVLQAKIGYRDATKSSQAQLIWRQYKLNYETKVFAITGEIARINKQEEIFKLKVRGKEIIDPSDLTASIEKESGFYIPLEQLEYWMKGEPYPHSNYRAGFNEDKLLVSLDQNQWHITYSEYEDGLARMIRASNPPYVIVLVVTSWKVNEKVDR